MTVARIGFAYNPTSEDALELRERAAGWCRMHGVEQWAAPAGDTADRLDELRRTDALVVLGGDGTFLRAAQSVAEVDVPIIGINLGKVGFLSMAEANELEALLEKLQAGAFAIRERMALTGQILQAGRTPDGDLHGAQRHRRRPRLPRAGRAGSTSASTSRTSRRSSRTGSSSPAPQAPPATPSPPAARSSSPTAGTSS